MNYLTTPNAFPPQSPTPNNLIRPIQLNPSSSGFSFPQSSFTRPQTSSFQPSNFNPQLQSSPFRPTSQFQPQAFQSSGFQSTSTSSFQGGHFQGGFGPMNTGGSFKPPMLKDQYQNIYVNNITALTEYSGYSIQEIRMSNLKNIPLAQRSSPFTTSGFPSSSFQSPTKTMSNTVFETPGSSQFSNFQNPGFQNQPVQRALFPNSQGNFMQGQFQQGGLGQQSSSFSGFQRGNTVSSWPAGGQTQFQNQLGAGQGFQGAGQISAFQGAGQQRQMGSNLLFPQSTGGFPQSTGGFPQSTGSSLFPQIGGSMIPQSTGGSLFPQTGGSLLPQAGGSLMPQSTGGSLFPQSTGGSLFPQSSRPSLLPQSTGGSLFPTGGSLFPQSTGGSLFPTGGSLMPPNTGSSLFPQTGGSALGQSSLLSQNKGSLFPQQSGNSLFPQVSYPQQQGSLFPTANSQNRLFPGSSSLFPQSGGLNSQMSLSGFGGPTAQGLAQAYKDPHGLRLLFPNQPAEQIYGKFKQTNTQSWAQRNLQEIIRNKQKPKQEKEEKWRNKLERKMSISSMPPSREVRPDYFRNTKSQEKTSISRSFSQDYGSSFNVFITYFTPQKNRIIFPVNNSIRMKDLQQKLVRQVPQLRLSDLAFSFNGKILEDTQTVGSAKIRKNSDLQLISIKKGLIDIISVDLLPKLTKLEYWTQPSLVKISRMSRKEVEKVHNFTIGNSYGKIVFQVSVNLVGVDLDSVVDIQPKQITMYPSQSGTLGPEKGTGLNQPATLYLFNCFPQKHIPPELFREKIKRVCEKNQSEFVSWDSVTGEWVFKVKYFS